MTPSFTDPKILSFKAIDLFLSQKGHVLALFHYFQLIHYKIRYGTQIDTKVLTVKHHITRSYVPALYG